jgi:cytochrome-b5 reductase
VQFRRTVPVQLDSESNSTIELVRSYTPVPSQFTKDAVGEKSCGSELYFLIKIYPNGALTPILGRLQPGDTIDISDPAGNFVPSFVSLESDKISDAAIYLFAAGTGITPMLSILPLIQQSAGATQAAGKIRQVVLLYFNRKELDIISRSELERYATQYR